MRLNLSQPYPLNTSLKRRLINSFLFGSFVFLFLFIFQPFELSQLPKDILLITFGYGVVCFVIMAILNAVAFLTLPSFFSESKWTIKKQILWIIVNVTFIGLGNYTFSLVMDVTTYNLVNLFLFEFYTIAVAVFPVAILTLANQVRLSNKFERQSEYLNYDIEKKQKKSIAETNFSIVTFGSGNDAFQLMIEDFLFAKSDDNYVEIYFLNDAVVSRKILRNTLKNVYSLCAEYKEIFKCHRSYIVNLKHVQRISGNAQGYKLHLQQSGEIIPVSRSLNKTIKLYFADNH